MAILLDIGIGAKTNVGYGKLVTPRPKPSSERRMRSNSTESSKFYKGWPKPGETIKLYGIIKPRKEKTKPQRVKFLTEPGNLIKAFPHEILEQFTPDDIVNITIELHPQKKDQVHKIISVSKV